MHQVHAANEVEISRGVRGQIGCDSAVTTVIGYGTIIQLALIGLFLYRYCQLS